MSDSGQSPPKDLEDILQLSLDDNAVELWIASVVQSFNVIEPWTAAHSTNWEIQRKFIPVIQEQGRSYCSAVKHSEAIADDCYAFCGEALLLFKLLSQTDDTKAEDLGGIITDMKTLAEEAHKKAKEASERFRLVRTALHDITKSIPSFSEEIGKKISHVRGKNEKAMKSRNSPQPQRRFASIPVAIDFADYIQGVGEIYTKKKIEGREKRIVKYQDAKDNFDQIGRNVAQLSDHIDVFAGWWIKQGMNLVELEKNIPKMIQLPSNQINNIRRDQVKGQWEKERQSYWKYKTTICRLQDYYPREGEETSVWDGFKRKLRIK